MLFYLWELWLFSQSLDQSKDGKIESKINDESAFTIHAKYSIKVYRIRMKRESIKIRNGKNGGKMGEGKIGNKWHHNAFSFYHYTVNLALVSERPINTRKSEGFVSFRTSVVGEMGRIASESSPNRLPMKPKWNQNQTKMKQKWNQNQTKMKQKWNKNETKMKPKWNQNETKMKPKWNQNETKINPKSNQNETKMKPKWTQNQTKIKPKWNKNETKMKPKWNQNETKMKPKWNQNYP
jgi:hypothetical protein